jgi:hypothetical protein
MMAWQIGAHAPWRALRMVGRAALRRRSDCSASASSSLHRVHGDRIALWNSIKRTVTTRDVARGRMLLIHDLLGCVQDQYEQYERTTFRSYAVAGTRIVQINASYNSGDAKIAERIHSSVVERVGSLK